MPDIYIPPNSTAVRNLVDRKMQVALDMMKPMN
jgi:hypothetical protein